MEDLASMCERHCGKACNLRSAAEELEETCSNGRARRYRKRGSPKHVAKARALETDPSPVRLRSGADSEGHSDGYRTAFPSESEEMARPPTRAHTAPEPSLEHDAEALERPTRARTAPVARHTEPQRDNMGDTPMAEESKAPETVGCARSGGKHVECHCEHVSFLIGKYPKMGMDAIVQHLDRLDNQKDGLEEDIAGILDDQSEAERDMAELQAEQGRVPGEAGDGPAEAAASGGQPPPPGGGHVGTPKKARGVTTPRLGSGAPGRAGNGRAGGAG